MSSDRRSFLGVVGLGAFGASLTGATAVSRGRLQEPGTEAEDWVRILRRSRERIRNLHVAFESRYTYLESQYAADPRRSFWANEGLAECFISTGRGYRITLTSDLFRFVDIAIRGRRLKRAEFLDGSRPPDVMYDRRTPRDAPIRDFVTAKFLPRPTDSSPVFALGSGRRNQVRVDILGQDLRQFAIDRERECVVAMDTFRNSTELREEMSLDDHVELISGLSFPRRVDFRALGTDGVTLSVLTFQVGEITINQPLPQGIFDFRS